MTDLPLIKIHYLGDVSGPAFLKLRHLKLRLEYPDGSCSEEFVHDVIERNSIDAAVIIAHDSGKVWMRSCVRPSIACRNGFVDGSGWELPAGLIDVGESPIEAAIRELKEEVGFDVLPKDLVQIGDPLFGAVGLTGEMLYFFGVDVAGLIRDLPAEDGSPIERFGICSLMDVETCMLSRDMKTICGISLFSRRA